MLLCDTVCVTVWHKVSYVTVLHSVSYATGRRLVWARWGQRKVTMLAMDFLFSPRHKQTKDSFKYSQKI